MDKALRVLNVEDSKRDVALLTRHLTAAGYEVSSRRVDTGEAMMDALSEREWDVILCDYSMPRFNALAALNLLHESGLDIPFIIISGTVGEEVAVEAMLTGAHDYLSKDNLTRLIPAIERELQEAENRRARRHAEESLKASEAELRALFAAMNDVIMVFDFEGRFLKIAPTDPGHLYKPSEDLIGKTLDQVFPAKTAELFLDPIHQAFSQNRTQSIEYSLPINGRETWFDGTVSPMSDNSVIWVSRNITERKVAEEKIRQSDHHLKEAQRLARAGSWNWDLQDNTLTWSDGHYHLFGLNPGEIDPNYESVVEQYIHPEDRGLVKSVVANSVKTLEPFSFYYRVVQRDRSEHIIHSRGKVVGDEQGKAIRIYGTAQDVTERKRAEEEQVRLNAQLENERRRLNNIVASVPGIVWEAWGEPDGATQRIDFVSDYVETMLGYSVEEWLSTPNFWLSIVHPDDRECACRISTEDFAGGKSSGPLEFRWITKDGYPLWVESNYVVIKDEDDRPVGMRGVNTDISERKRSEEALSASEERYRDMVENAIDIIYTHDLTGNYTSVNRAGEKITGYTREEALKMNLIQTVVPQYREKATQMMEAKLAGKEITAYELEIIAKDGHQVSVEVSTRIVFANGVPVGIQGIARDITERKKLEEQFLQSQKMEAIGLLAGGIAHDFNNLLTAILGYSDLTLKRMPSENPLRLHIKEIRHAGDRAAALTNQLLAFSRKQVLKPRVHNLNAIITDIEKMLRRIIRESIEFRVVLDSDLGNIRADPGQIEQVIMNLAVNARDAMPQGGVLTIETRNVEKDESENTSAESGRFVKMIVTDSGEGMDEQTQRRIFEPFFTTKGLGKGTGLGLSTVHGIVKQSGGDIMVYSKIGRGTTFEIKFPIVDETIEKPKWLGVGEEKYSGTETILVVEDEEIVRHLVREILVSNGYKVLEAADGKAALYICDTYSESIHLLLTDVVMPQMSGPQLKERVARLRPDVKPLFMSGYTDDSIVKHGIFDSNAAFIEKPFTPDSLVRKIREVLES